MNVDYDADLFPQGTVVRLMRAAWERNPRAVASLLLDHELDCRMTAEQKRRLCRIAGRGE
jgi:hypothetical protein